MASMKLSAAGVLLATLLSGCGEERPWSSPEAVRAAADDANILVVLLDAATAHHFGCYGYDRDTTPNLDRVAAESVVFENAYSQASGTMLSVFSYFTSRYPVFGPRRKFRPEAPVQTIPPELRTFAERLAPIFGQRLGYTSNVWMKRHLGHDQGFTEYWEVWDPPAELDGILTDDAQAVTLAAAWMKERADDRFLAYLHLMKPHTPYDPPMPYFSRFAEREIDPTVGTHEYIQSIRGQRPDDATVRDIVALYDANLAYADAMVGELISELKAAGVWKRTIFVLMSDHGQSLYEFGHSHGHGGNVFDATVHVPLFIRIPGLPELAGRRVNAPVELVDLVPTLLDLTGLDVPADSLAGRSLLPLLAGRPADDEGPRLIHSRTNRLMPPVFSLTRGQFKLTAETVKRQHTRYALFDLKGDPGEVTDLLREQPDHPEGKALRSLMEAWLGSGTREGATSSGVEFDVFDPEEVERLRSLGYVN